MKKVIYLNGKKIEYEIEYKRVKNINLRIKPSGEIFVSASKRISENIIEEFVASKTDFILKALEIYKTKKEKEHIQYFDEDEIRRVVTEICNEVYPYYEKLGVKYPEIKFRKMVSRWGSCHPKKGILTFNTALMYTPKGCIQYVVLHEFTHFLVPNHSAKFYNELEKVCPEWKKYRQILKDTLIDPI